jgi:hypothetical protein
MYIEPQTGTVVGRQKQRTEHEIVCACGCGGYWDVRWDTMEKPNDVIAFLAHDLTLLDIVDQLASRAEDDDG